MAEGLELVGELTIAGLCPLVVEANAAVLAELQAKLAGCLSLQASLTVTPPTLAANLELATQLVASLTAAIEVGLPGVDFQLTVVAALIASIQGQLEALLALQALMGATVIVWEYGGPASALGPALTSALAVELPDGTPSASAVNGLVVLTPSPETWLSVKAFFGGIP
jgi:phage tail protein X